MNNEGKNFCMQGLEGLICDDLAETHETLAIFKDDHQIGQGKCDRGPSKTACFPCSIGPDASGDVLVAAIAFIYRKHRPLEQPIHGTSCNRSSATTPLLETLLHESLRYPEMEHHPSSWKVEYLGKCAWGKSMCQQTMSFLLMPRHPVLHLLRSLVHMRLTHIAVVLSKCRPTTGRLRELHLSWPARIIC